MKSDIKTYEHEKETLSARDHEDEKKKEGPNFRESKGVLTPEKRKEDLVVEKDFKITEKENPTAEEAQPGLSERFIWNGW